MASPLQTFSTRYLNPSLFPDWCLVEEWWQSLCALFLPVSDVSPVLPLAIMLDCINNQSRTAFVCVCVLVLWIYMIIGMCTCVQLCTCMNVCICACVRECQRSASVSSSTSLLYFLRMKRLMNWVVLGGQWSEEIVLISTHPPSTGVSCKPNC